MQNQHTNTQLEIQRILQSLEHFPIELRPRIHATQNLCRLIGRFLVARSRRLTPTLLQQIVAEVEALTGLPEQIIKPSLVRTISRNREVGSQRAEELLQRGLEVVK